MTVSYTHLSQKKAVAAAFEHQVSVVQGPPGTGKTQTILNVIANIVRDGKTVLVVSNNNSAITNVQEKLEKYGFAFIVAPLGSKENKELFISQQTLVPVEVSSWSCSMQDGMRMKSTLHDTDVYKRQLYHAAYIDEIEANGWSLTPSRYIKFEDKSVILHKKNIINNTISIIDDVHNKMSDLNYKFETIKSEVSILDAISSYPLTIIGDFIELVD